MKEFLLPHGTIADGLQLKKAYFAWAWLLDDGIYIPKSIQGKLFPLKMRIDNAPPSKTDRKRIAIQAMAQVISYRNNRFISAKIKPIIANFMSDAPTILHLGDWRSIKQYRKKCENEDGSDPKDLLRDIEKYIAQVRPNESEPIKLIPKLFEGKDVQTIYFPRLLHGLTCLVFMLIACKENPDEIINHSIIDIYRKNLPSLFHDLINQHVQGACRKSVAFFA